MCKKAQTTGGRTRWQHFKKQAITTPEAMQAFLQKQRVVIE
ncbi:hypothetical protein BIFADO_00730 [Bifidobacterium adolescentis L2-32]|uniref:Uncharacterized protein n=1 Tax=Bifidobacterium adolescentis L2-32 TaxID=411481 RepID=A7A4H2_BIFAD|nr:hypothetical protein BIFADO_00730 [Bifidobacterium adolescentis L2-32]